MGDLSKFSRWQVTAKLSAQDGHDSGVDAKQALQLIHVSQYDKSSIILFKN